MWHVTQSMFLTSLPQKFSQNSLVRFFVLLSTESGGGEIRAVNPIILLPDTLTCLPSNNFLLSGQFFEWESKQRTNKYVQEKLPRTPIAVGQTYYYHQEYMRITSTLFNWNKLIEWLIWPWSYVKCLEASMFVKLENSRYHKKIKSESRSGRVHSSSNNFQKVWF